MRRAWITLAVGLLVLATAAPASAGEHIEVQNRVFQGHRLKVKVLGCVGGETWNAVIQIELFDPDRPNRILRSHQSSVSDTGLDIFKLRITRKDFPRGLYKARVMCIHEFDEGPKTFFNEREGFRVLEPD